MIRGSFTHINGIGPVTERRLRNSGFETWDDCLVGRDTLPFRGNRKSRFLGEIRESRTAHDRNDLRYLISRFSPREHWRILAEYIDHATFFDIETTGLSWHYNHASVIAAYHRGRILSFRYRQNLDDFLDVIDEAELLITFNGSSFDLPFVEKTFNIPPIDTPHIDIRWVAFHLGHSGGLKIIEKKLGINRPARVKDIDGFEAVDLFHRWQAGDHEAGMDLERYCRADAASCYLLARRLLEQKGVRLSPVNEDALFREAMRCTGE